MTDVGVTTTASLSERVAEEIRVALTRRRMSAARLARELGVSQTYVWRRLEGQTAFDLDDLEKIAAILEVPIVELLRRAAGPDSLNLALTNAHLTATAASPTSPFRESASRPSGPLRRDLRGDRTRPVSAIPANRRRPTWVKSRSPAA
jgi:transcriptional regulator with XRE-family HTH domain